jgi:DNA-binding transcriptional regulator YiaG
MQDDLYAARDAALRAAHEAYVAAIEADPDDQRALIKARDVGEQLRGYAKVMTSLVGIKAMRIRDRERLTLAKLAERFGVSTPMAQQWYDKGRTAQEHREDAT